MPHSTRQKASFIFLFFVLATLGVSFFLTAESWQLIYNGKVGPDTLVNNGPAIHTKSSGGKQSYCNPQFGFQLKLPADYEIVGDLNAARKESSPRLAIFARNPYRRGDAPYVDIYLPVAGDEAANPNALNLDDYKSDYHARFFDVLIHSQEVKTIDARPVLKQIYSAGEWRTDLAGNQRFYVTSENAEDHSIRYVFWNGGSEFIIFKNKGLKPEFEQLLDSVAETFSFVQNHCVLEDG